MRFLPLRWLRRRGAFRGSESGTALVEFGMSLPLILVVGYGSIDSMRLFWSYQAAVAGVRDATRYVARVAPANICTAGGNLNGFQPRIVEIIEQNIDQGEIFPDGVTFSNVTAGLFCESSLGLRQAQVPVATVSADLTLTLPYTRILTLVGGSTAGTLTTTVSEQARIFGL